ncbi:hypothetical protein ACGFK1_14945 [Mycobacterium sp. NPDC048908]|uniref:hypothetical protein n=1 Tax=Mycobacterium sp. NPDC048908 TaxID=3364292 RepID=UPI003713EEBF
MTVVVTALVVGKNSGGGGSPTPTNGSDSEFASANDKGPVGIITEDPTCAAWSKVGAGLTDAEQRVRWLDRDASVPAASWTLDQRTTFESVGQAMVGAADQAAALTKTTPHRVMRELYEQFIAYARAFAERIPSYTPRDNDLARVADGVGGVLANVCGAITYGSAQAEAPLIPPVDPPSSVSPPSNPADARRLLTDDDPICSEWVPLLKRFFDDTAAWQAISETIPATQWTSEQKAAYEAVVPVMSKFADDLEALGRRSGNATMEDFAVLSAQYRRAFVKAIPTYTAADNYLASTATYVALTVDQACKAVASG